MTFSPGWYNDSSGTPRYWNGHSWVNGETANPAEQAINHYQPPVSTPAPPVVHQPHSYGYAAQPVSNGIAVAGFVVGLVSIFLPLVFGLVAGLTGLGLSIGGMTRANSAGGKNRGLAIAGLVLSIVGVIFIL